MRSKRTVIILIFSLLILHVPAQNNDAGLWASAAFEKDIGKKAVISLSQEVRLMNNFSEATTIFTELEGTYKLTKNLRLAAGYRYESDRRPDGTYSHGGKLIADLILRSKIHQWTFTLRERFQSASPGLLPLGESVESKSYLRSKATAKINLSQRLAPYISTDWYLPLNDAETRSFSRVRNMAGFEFRLTPKQNLDFSYMVQLAFDRRKQNLFVIGIGYTLSL